MFRPPSVGKSLHSLHQRSVSGGSEGILGDFHTNSSSVTASSSSDSSSPTLARSIVVSSSESFGVVNPNSSTLISLLEDSDDEKDVIGITDGDASGSSHEHGHHEEPGSTSDLAPRKHHQLQQQQQHHHHHHHRKAQHEQNYSKEGKASKVLRILNPIPLTSSNHLSLDEFYDVENASFDCCAQWSHAATHIFFSQQFPTLYIVLILLNLLTLAIIVYEHATSKWEDGYPMWFIGLEMTISIAFAIELGIRLASMGRKFFETFSNVFDLCTLLLCLVSFVVYFRLEFHETQAEELAALFLVLRYSAQFLRLLTLVKNRQKTIHLSQSIVDFTKVQAEDLGCDDIDVEENAGGGSDSRGNDDSPTHRHYFTPRNQD